MGSDEAAGGEAAGGGSPTSPAALNKFEGVLRAAMRKLRKSEAGEVRLTAVGHLPEVQAHLVGTRGHPGGSLLSLVRAVAEQAPDRFELRAESTTEAADNWWVRESGQGPQAAQHKKSAEFDSKGRQEL